MFKSEFATKQDDDTQESYDKGYEDKSYDDKSYDEGDEYASYGSESYPCH